MFFLISKDLELFSVKLCDSSRYVFLEMKESTIHHKRFETNLGKRLKYAFYRNLNSCFIAFFCFLFVFFFQCSSIMTKYLFVGDRALGHVFSQF